MPEPARRRRAVVAAATLVALVAAPAALAQTGEAEHTERQQRFWGRSTIDAPFTDFETVVTSGTIDFAGHFLLEPELPSDRIELVTVTFSDDPEDDFEPAEGCTVPEPAVFTSESEPGSSQDDELRFDVDDARFPCNGRYLASAVGRANRPDIPEYELRRALVIVERPAPITELEATVGSDGDEPVDDEPVDDTPVGDTPVDDEPVGSTPDEGSDDSGDPDEWRVTITFTPLPPEQRPLDLEGYRVERAGPATASGEYGVFEPVGADLAVDDEPRAEDARSGDGTYAYRVRAIRSGPRQPVLSSPSATPIVEVSSSDTVNDPGTDGGDGSDEGGSVTRPSRSRTLPKSTSTRRSSGSVRVPTTADTGFDGELDYGGGPAVGPGFEGSDEELGSGQSIVREEGGDGADLIAPVAGALVLLGWAAHIAYLNRLAKHL